LISWPKVCRAIRQLTWPVSALRWLMQANIHAAFQRIALKRRIHAAVRGDDVLESQCLAKLKQRGLVLRARFVLLKCFVARAAAIRVAVFCLFLPFLLSHVCGLYQ